MANVGVSETLRDWWLHKEQVPFASTALCPPDVRGGFDVDHKMLLYIVKGFPLDDCFCPQTPESPPARCKVLLKENP